MDSNDEDLFHRITVVSLREICCNHCQITEYGTKTRAKLHEYISQQAPEIIDAIRNAVNRAVASGEGRHRKRLPASDLSPRPRQIRRTLPSATSTASTPVNPSYDTVSPSRLEEILNSEFLKPPTEAQLDASISWFIDATNNAALQAGTCASCARLRFQRNLREIEFGRLPHARLLQPSTPHPAQELFGPGLLVHRDGVVQGGTSILICPECLTSLKFNKMPKFSLANDMWIGDIPTALQNLTLPERVLISKYFCAAYIIKLYPKQKGAQSWASSGTLHSALRGNVCTYRLDPNQVASLVQGERYPPNAKILSATIGVTFVGPKGLTEKTMPSMFRVRRRKVREALEWLKINNPIYSDIIICEESLNLLPVDDIPDEIMSVVKYSDNLLGVEREHAGYVPEDDVNDNDVLESAMQEVGLQEVDDNGMETEVQPAVIPLQSLGVVDIDGEDISSQELMAHALVNTIQQDHDFENDEFAIRRGSAFVNEYARVDAKSGQRNDGGPSNPNHLLGCFPVLFPYGRGGVETHRTVKVSYELHIRWSMEYTDRRFRKDPQFPYQVFGVMQKRRVCRSVGLQMNYGSFRQNMRLITSLKPADLEQASQEETRGVSHRNPAIRALRKELSAVRTRVPGTDESRMSVRSKVWGTNLIFNPPSIWLTINPADTQDPIAQVLTGADINLDEFCHTAGPDNVQRAVNVASDPFASAQFFRFIITTVLEEVFGIKQHANGKFQRQPGILGRVQAYIGTVEAQGRGTLHFHCLIWLSDAPTAHELQAALLTEEFRNKMRDYIDTTINADLRGRNREQVRAMPKQPGISYSRPVDPRSPNSAIETTKQRESLVRNLQFHQCSLAACLKTVRGKLVCKRRAPFALAAQAWVDEQGNWGPKRLCDMLNGFHPSLMTCIRANHDLKLISSGKDTATITYYITNYATKKQEKSSNVTSLLAKSLAFSKAKDKKLQDLNEINRKMIIRCANSLTRYREFSGPEIMTYIMGWPDVYESHTYVTIFWDSAIQFLKQTFPYLEAPPIGHVSSDIANPSDGGVDEEGRHVSSDLATASDEWGVEEGSASEGAVPAPNTSSRRNQQLLVMVDGQMALKDQLRDYIYRGEELVGMSFLDFHLETYDGKWGQARESEGSNADEHPIPMRGRPLNRRVGYKPEAKKEKMCRIFRTSGHETLPRFVGRWFPRSNSESEREKELYSASMLMLLQPWTDLRQLKSNHSSFTLALEALVGTGNRKIHTVMHNIEYFYECSDGAKRRREEERTGTVTEIRSNIDLDMAELRASSSEEGRVDYLFDEITEEIIQATKNLRINDSQGVYATLAITQAFESGIFTDPPTNSTWRNEAVVATSDNMAQIHAWAKQLTETTRNMSNVNLEMQAPEDTAVQIRRVMEGEVRLLTHNVEPAVMATPSRDNHQISRPLLALLNREQKLAHDIIEDTLKEHIEHGCAKQLRMLIMGQGGTGKSMLIGAITETFDFYGQLHILAKCATTGIAATDIGGQTLHSWAGLSINVSKAENWLEKVTNTTQDKRKKNIEGKQVLIIDEISMAEKKNLFAVSEIVGSQRAKAFEGSAEEPFGGMHVIMCGDFHQFPPVINSEGALYVEKSETDRRAAIGRAIFKQFDTVVFLKEQVRVKDQVWTDILNRLRVGDCTDDDIKEIDKLVLGHPECDVPDFQTGPWSTAILVTLRHRVRQLWNEHALAKHCAQTKRVKYIAPAEDVDKSTDTAPSLRARLAMAETDMNKRCKLPESIEVAVGMKAMVILNIATEADIANGTQGTIEKIMLDEREATGLKPDDEGIIRLKYPPAMLLFRPDRPTHVEFPGVEKGLIPITPSEALFAVTHVAKEFRIQRRQYPLTAGYAFTDYKAQGQTIEYVIIDIGNPPGKRLSPFGTYVALSRSRGRDNIRLLREFDPDLFQKHPSQGLADDMKRLEQLALQTKRRRGITW